MQRKPKQLILITVLMLLIPFSFAGTAQDNSNVIVFISFSMPKESIKGWMNEANKLHAPVVIRGLVNNSFKETLHRMNELVSDNRGGLQLDPVLFKKFQIKKVPAVVVRRMNQYDVAYGDSHLDYALETVIKQNDALSDIAQQALVSLREGKHV